MNILIDRAATRLYRPWGNQAGMAGELLVLPKGTPAGRYDLRIGVATVEQTLSTFTRYPGYLRRHAVLRGHSSFTCEAPFGQAPLGSSATVFEFDGDLALHCRLLGASAFALNIIHRDSTCVVDELLNLPASGFSRIAPLSGGLRVELFYLLAPGAEVRIDGQVTPLWLSEHDALISLRRPCEPSPALSFINTLPGQLYHATVHLPPASEPAAYLLS